MGNIKKKKKDNNTKYIVLISIVLIIVGVFLINYNKNTPRGLKELKDLVTFPGRIFKREVNITLSKEFTSEAVKEKDNDIKELKEILDLNIINSEYEFINSTIINRDSILWYENFTIDKGRYAKIKPGMCVINNDGFIGQVAKTTNNTSEIVLITSPKFDSKISVLINKEYGVITKYDLEENVLLVDGISNLNKINIGDKVITSSLTSRYPSGVLIGSVSGKRKDKFNIEKYVEVKLSANVKTSRYVSVLKK